MSVQQGSGFRACGAVYKNFVPASRKCAFLTVEFTNERGKTTKLETRTFDAGVIEQVGKLGKGETVEVTGSIDSEVPKDKAKADVTVDGRALWVPMLKLKTIKVVGEKPKPAENLDDGQDDGWR